FTAHSLPARVLELGDPYPDQLRATATAVAAELGLAAWSQWSIAWQSAGRTPEPWLGPDVLQVIDELAGSEHPAPPGGDARLGLVVCACGFVADHLEVLYDLDLEAAQRARSRGLEFARTACVNDDPAVMAALASRVVDASCDGAVTAR
ncbi:MAG: ferrochelatase, partial [Actinobacteria bacterium]|nr:ferrochelatase [Actinomycetota bacterium]